MQSRPIVGHLGSSLSHWSWDYDRKKGDVYYVRADVKDYSVSGGRLDTVPAKFYELEQVDVLIVQIGDNDIPFYDRDRGVSGITFVRRIANFVCSALEHSRPESEALVLGLAPRCESVPSTRDSRGRLRLLHSVHNLRASKINTLLRDQFDNRGHREALFRRYSDRVRLIDRPQELHISGEKSSFIDMHGAMRPDCVHLSDFGHSLMYSVVSTAVQYSWGRVRTARNRVAPVPRPIGPADPAPPAPRDQPVVGQVRRHSVYNGPVGDVPPHLRGAQGGQPRHIQAPILRLPVARPEPPRFPRL